MKTKEVRVLLIQDNPTFEQHLKEKLGCEKDLPYQLTGVSTLKGAMSKVLKASYDLIISELNLSDSQGIETFKRVQLCAQRVPIIILADMQTELEALRAVELGAQDYLLKSEAESSLLIRMMHNAIQRHKMRVNLMDLSLKDELSGLYNRRGFFFLAEQQMKLAARSKREMILLMMDLDGLKKINDAHGHHYGDLALVQTARILKDAFRKSDIIARIGGDEFCVLAVEAHRTSDELIKNRLHIQFKQYSQSKKLPFPLSMSIGSAHFDPQKTTFLEQIMQEADSNLYHEKEKLIRT